MSKTEEKEQVVSSPVRTAVNGNWLDLVTRQVEALKFGSVHITVHEGRVVQIETSVRVRFDKAT